MRASSVQKNVPEHYPKMLKHCPRMLLCLRICLRRVSYLLHQKRRIQRMIQSGHSVQMKRGRSHDYHPTTNRRPPVPKRPCLQCGAPTNGSRCPAHKLPTPGRQENSRRKQTVGRWLEEQGPWCPGWGVPGHMCDPSDLTADHIIPISKGGMDGPLRVCCRACNSRRGNQNPTPPAA